VHTWGWGAYGGNSEGKNLSNVVTIYSNFYAFVASKSNGDIVAWGGGGATYGGIAPAGLNNVKIYSNRYAFVAVDVDQNIVTSWGNEAYGGTGSAPHKVLDIYSNYYTFAALLTDRTVYCWGGDETTGSVVPSGLTHVVSIASTEKAFAALKSDAKVTA